MTAALLLLLLVQAPPAIKQERLGEDHYRLRITVPDSSDVARAQTLLAPTAQRLCGAMPFRFGRYRFAATESVATGGARTAAAVELEQELHCGGEAPVQEPVAVPRADWQPAPADDQAVRQATDLYYAARAGGRYAEAHAMLSDRMQDLSPLAAFSDAARAETVRFGPGRRRVVAVTWYNSPPEAPVAGIYAALDFVGDYERLHLLCGYAIWLLQPDGGWRLIRTEEAVVQRSPESEPGADVLAQMRAQFRCRG